jgi:predicted component of type VI protein secretion system
MKLPRNCRFQQIAYAISQTIKKIETRIKEIILASILAQRRNFSTEDLLYELA